MIQDYERYHGVALRSLIVEAPKSLTIKNCDEFGRLNSYLLNDQVAVHLKHSSKRLAPWNFGFTSEQLAEVSGLKSMCGNVWLIFICGSDGIVSLSLNEFLELAESTPGGTRSVRINRAPRQRYRVKGNATRVPELKPGGIARILENACNVSASELIA